MATSRRGGFGASNSSLPACMVAFAMGWIYLLIASCFEIGWAVGLKMTAGWTRLWPSVITIILILFSYVFLSLALKTLPLGTAYAVWTGIGAVGTAVAGILLFAESRNPLRLVFMVLILAGIAGLKLADTASGSQKVTATSGDASRGE